MVKILFVCTGNTCRSPMASALLLRNLQGRGEMLANGEIQIWSAGLFTQDGLSASAEAIEAMREEGIDISRHRSRLIRDNLIEAADLILTMTVSQRDYLQDRFPHKLVNIFTLGEFAGDGSGEVIDPYGHGREVYQECMIQLKQLVDMLSYKIIKMR